MKTYSQKLLDVRWQKKRLLIFQRDNWTCRDCGATTSTLHVHHEMYSGEPWDIADDKLKTLCDKCHNKEHTVSAPSLEELEEIRQQLIDKISNSYNRSAINTWRQAVSVIESEALKHYGVNLQVKERIA